jgi:curved DNA-binding protein CbpA
MGCLISLLSPQFFIQWVEYVVTVWWRCQTCCILYLTWGLVLVTCHACVFSTTSTGTTGVEAAGRNKRQSTSSTKKGTPNFDADDYYAVLGLSKGCKTNEIKKAYRKLALQYHPDKQTTDEEKTAAESIFVKVSEAYAVLSDDEKRKIYDKYGKGGLEAYERGQDPAAAGFGGFGAGPGGGGGSRQFHFQHGGAGFDPFDLFNNMFNGDFGGSAGGGNFHFQTGGSGFGGSGFSGGGGFGGHGARQQQRGPPSELFPKGEGNVTKLGSPKFPDAKSKHLWLVVFYRNDVSACVEAKPKIDQLAEKVTGTYKVGAINCALNTKETAFCQKKGIKKDDLPVFGFVVDGEITFFEADEDDPPIPSARDLHDFALDNMPKSLVHNINHVSQIQERLLSPITSNKKLRGGVLLLTDKYETSALYFSLAYQFRSTLRFGESRAKNLALSKEFGVKKYPLLVALVPKGTTSGGRTLKATPYNDQFDLISYHGSLKSQEISAWLNKLPPRDQHTEL